MAGIVSLLGCGCRTVQSCALELDHPEPLMFIEPSEAEGLGGRGRGLERDHVVDADGPPVVHLARRREQDRKSWRPGGKAGMRGTVAELISR